MLGIFVYIIIQVAFFGASVLLLLYRRDAKRENVQKKVPTWKMLSSLFVIPIIGFGYATLGGWPLKNDQVAFAVVLTALGYGSVIFRRIRQSHVSTIRDESKEPQYLYRSNDGTICGPVQRSTLLSRYQSGLVHIQSPIAKESAPNDWKPWGKYPELQNLNNN